MARRTSSAREMPSLRAIASSAPRSFSGISTIVLTSEVYHCSLSYKPVSSTSLKAVKEARSKAAGRRPGSTAAGRRSERERSESLPCTVTDSLSCRPEMNTSGSLTEQQAVGPAQIDRSEAKGTPHSTHSRSCTDRSAFHLGTWNSELLPPVSRSPWNVER